MQGIKKELMEDKRQTLTIIEAAKILGIGRNQAYEAARRGEIPTIKIGRRILVPLAALEKSFKGQSDARALLAVGRRTCARAHAAAEAAHRHRGRLGADRRHQGRHRRGNQIAI